MKAANLSVVKLLGGGGPYLTCDLITITLIDNTTILFTDHNSTLTTDDGRVFVPFVFSRGKTSAKIGLESTTLDLTLFPNSTDLISGITYQKFAHDGKFDGASVKVEKMFLTDFEIENYGLFTFTTSLYGKRLTSRTLTETNMAFSKNSYTGPSFVSFSQGSPSNSIAVGYSANGKSANDITTIEYGLRINNGSFLQRVVNGISTNTSYPSNSSDNYDVTYDSDNFMRLFRNGTQLDQVSVASGRQLFFAAWFASNGSDQAFINDVYFGPRNKFRLLLPDPYPVGSVIQFSGNISSAQPSRTKVELTLKSGVELLNVQWPRQTYQPSCINSLYGPACGALRASHNATGTVLTGATKSSFLTNLTQANDTFSQGDLIFTSGMNINEKRTIKFFDSATVDVTYPLKFAPANGDTFTIYKGCNKTLTDCKVKFANQEKFRGFRFVPAPETVY